VLDKIQKTTLAGISSRLNPHVQIKANAETRNMRRPKVLPNSALMCFVMSELSWHCSRFQSTSSTFVVLFGTM